MLTTEMPRMRLADLVDTRWPTSDRIAAMCARLIGSEGATTRPALTAATGLARSTIGVQLERLLAAGLVVESGAEVPARGRPAQSLALGPNSGYVAVIELTPHHARLAVSTLTQQLVAHQRIQLDITEGPDATLAIIEDTLTKMLNEEGLVPEDLSVAVMSLPGPVDIRRGRPVRPPIMPGWDEFPVAESITARLACPTLIDNDVNLMALGEARSLPTDQCPLLFVKIGTGIGGGLVTADGVLHHGADGAAFDIGHLSVPGESHVVCSCGNTGCVEALASAEAMAGQLREILGDDSLTQVDLERRLAAVDPTATRLVRTAAATIGEVVAALVHICNPARIAIGSPLAAASDDILAGIRSVVYQRALPLATRNLTLAHSSLGEMAGIAGGIVLGIEHVLSPDGMGRRLAGPHGRPAVR